MSRLAPSMVEEMLHRLDGGFLQIYEGEKMLAQMRFSDPAFRPISSGIAFAHPLMVGTGRADGVASGWAALTEDGVPVLAGVVGDDMLLNQRYIATGAEVRITSFSYRQEAS